MPYILETFLCDRAFHFSFSTVHVLAIVSCKSFDDIVVRPKPTH